MKRIGKIPSTDWGALQIPDLRNRILFIAGMFALFISGLTSPRLLSTRRRSKDLTSSGVFGLIDIMSGGALRRLSILALGIVPYINASIIMQLLGIAVPEIQRLQKEGDTGRKVISMYTRIGPWCWRFCKVPDSASFFINNGAVDKTYGYFSLVPLIIVMAAGTSFLMWMGEQLTDKGIGNGISLIIFAGILIRLPNTSAASRSWPLRRRRTISSKHCCTSAALC